MPHAITEFADAFPRKRFFVEMFTRDIALEDCILDLVDNSIDSLIRVRSVDLEDEIISNHRIAKKSSIALEVSPKFISVTDDCGGIPLEKAKHEVFNFGHSLAGAKALTERGLGAYGIGLKRAIFKIGKEFTVESSHGKDSFRVTENLDRWIQNDSSLDQWRFPLTEVGRSELLCPRNGTRIEVSGLYESIKNLAKGPDFLDALVRAISRTYAFFLARHVNISLNGRQIEPTEVPIGTTTDYRPSTQSYTDDGVSVRLRAGLAPVGAGGKWQMERAGWYVLCNGRIVVAADKTALTGWGAGILPQFHSSKARGFVGLALFTADDPLKLPWTTTKRGLNRESPVFLRARSKMQSVARPVYDFLNSLYPSGDDATGEEREAAKQVTQASAKALFGESASTFKAPTSRKASTHVSVQFKVEKKAIEAVKKHLERPSMSASEIGKHAFDYFVENEELL